MLAPRKYLIQTLGCQMNSHDSERIAGSLDAAGYIPARSGEEPDLIVFNTCAVRENADNKLYGHLSFLAPLKRTKPDLQIAIGGCLAQKDRGSIIERAPYVDVVFGTHNLASLPSLLERARIEEKSQVEIKESLEHFPSVLPARRHSPFSAWVSISVGCNNTCTFCIVPALRGREKDRPTSEILDEIRALVDQGVTEVTLLGQNVNAYGVDFSDREAFAKLLRSCGQIEGLDRVRFMSPHPRDFTDEVIDAMAETHNVMPHLHMPLQSGSDKILQAMRRSYRSDRYRTIIDRVRTKIPDSTITSDIIVGFPGETEEDFQATLDICSDLKFLAAYSFKYSKRPGTSAATMPNQVPEELVSERYDRLHNLLNRTSLEVNQAVIGKELEVLITDVENGKAQGKSRDFRLVHFELNLRAHPGDLAMVKITDAKPHFIFGELISIRETKGGLAFQSRKAEAEISGVFLGVPEMKSVLLK
ncbi:MAG: tRNA (N6-isopentenyl adenosine(37)-C2)-methylthiotransferase MiaB [Actinobacteria bacterium]|nr:tRNA (N6-isopentenyl adenosine(37)-C2)-methylthiotransferase MiaB [Actinomycetota bacterium]